MPSRRRMSLRNKLIAAVVAIEVGMIALVLANGASLFRDYSIEAARTRLSELMPALVKALEQPLAQRNLTAVAAAVDAVYSAAALDYAVVIDANGQVLARRDRYRLDELPPADAKGGLAAAADRIDIVAAIPSAPGARVQVGLALGLPATLRERVLAHSVIIAGATLLLTLLTLYLVTHLLTRGLGKLVAATRMIEHGKYSLQVSVRSNDEIGELTNAFNHMARAVRENFAALKANEQRFRALTRIATDWYWEQDTDCRFSYLSDEVTSIAGMAPSDHLGKARWELPNTQFDEETLTSHQALLAEHLPFADLEFSRVDSEGRRRYFSVSGEPMFDAEGRFAGYRGIGRDITARKLAEQRLEDSERRFRATFEQAAVGMMHLDLDGRIRWANERLGAVLGFSRSELEAKSFEQLLYPEDVQRDRLSLEKLRSGDAVVFSGDRRCLRSDAGTVWCHLTLSMQRTVDGRPEYFIGVVEDITARRQVEEALRENEERHRMLTELLPDAVIIHRNRRILMVNRAALMLFGALRAEELIGQDIVERVHPDYRDVAARRIAFLDAHLAQGLRVPSADQIYLTLQGASVDVEATAALVDLADGSAILTVARDISERKQAERALQAREELLSAMAQSVPAIMMQFDRELRIEFANAAAVAALGSDAERLIGRRLVDLLPVNRYRAMEAELERALRGETVEREGASRLRPDRHYHETLRPRLDARGAVVGVYFFGYDVSERTVAERAMREAEERIRTIADTMPSAIVYVDRERRFQFVNRIFYEATGLRPDQVIGHPLGEVYGPERLALLEPALQKVFRGEPVTLEASSLFRPNRIIQSTYLPHFGASGEVVGYYYFGYDITERIQSERALRASEEKMRTVADMIPGVIVSADENLCVTFANRGFFEGTGLSPEAVIGKPIAEVYGPERYARLDPLFKTVLEGRAFSMESSSVYHGERIVHSTFLPQYDTEHKVVGFYYFGYDITAQKTAEAEVRRLNADLERRVAERTAELEASNRELEAFAYSVAHDLRTPLRAIDGFSQAVMLQSAGSVDETMKKSLGRVRAASQRMGQMIDDLLRLARVTRGELKRQDLDLSVMVREILFDLQQAEPRREVECVIQDEVPGNGDPILLHAVFENLLANAWKFTRKKAKARIEFGQRDTGSGKAYFVADNGAGFDMAYASKLFSPFQRLHTPEEYSGNGIGLATVHRILQRHGGRIWAQAAVNQGATFYFTL